MYCPLSLPLWGSQLPHRGSQEGCQSLRFKLQFTCLDRGDIIKEKHKGSQRYKDILEVTAGRLVPEWLEADAEKLTVTVKAAPTREMIDVPVDEMLIVELYSK